MPAIPVADLAALDALYQRRAILIDDHRAGREFALLAERRTRAFYRPLYMAAIDALDRSGGRSAVETVVMGGYLPHPWQVTTLARLADGLDALATHFRAKGLL